MKGNSNKIVIILLLALLFLLLSGCEEEEDHFQITIFTQLQEMDNEDMEDFINGELENRVDSNINVDLYPPRIEKLVVEVIDHSGDIIIMDRGILPSIMDSEGLHELDDLIDLKRAGDLEGLQEKDENGNEHLYAVPLDNIGPLFGSKYSKVSFDLVAVIPKYSNYEEVAFTLLKELAER